MVPATCSLADTLPHAPPARRTAGFAESIQLAGGFARLNTSSIPIPRVSPETSARQRGAPGREKSPPEGGRLG